MFKFLKRLRRDKPIETPEVIQEVLVVEPVVEVIPEPVVEEVKVETPKPQLQKVEQPKPVEKPAVAVQEVELPKRSLGDGIRSLFSSAVELDDLEDILIRADFGVDAALEISDELKRAANKAGASSDAELRLLLKDLLTQKLTRTDAALP